MVYLICLEEKVSGHAKHYVGHCLDIRLKTRLQEHRTGNGKSANLLRVAKEQNIEWTMVRGWPKGSKTLEKRIKLNGKIDKLCPCCNPDNWKNYGKYKRKKMNGQEVEKKWFAEKSYKKWKEGR